MSGKYPLLQLLLTGMLITVYTSSVAQGEYIWDKNHSCKCFSYLNASSKPSFTFSGQCKDGYVSGNGTVTFYLNGEKWSIYSGNFERGFLNGKGSFEFIDAFKYEGGFSEFKRQGKGKVTDLRTGEVMEANFNNDQLTGEVKIKYTNGDSYAGGVRPAQWTIKEGKGIYYFRNGDRFEGVFIRDACESGTMYYKNGSSETGKLTGEGQNYSFKKIENANAATSVPTLNQLQSWITSGYTKFDTEIKKLGFKLEDKKVEDGVTSYFYTRSANASVNDVISFVADKEQTGIEMILQQNFFAAYKPAINANKYVSSTCNTLELIGVETGDCKEYENDLFLLMLHQWRELSDKKPADREPFSYTAKILLKKK